MPEDRAVVRAIAWREILPPMILLRSFRIATRVRMLLLAALAMLLTTLGWWVCGGLFSGASDPLLAAEGDSSGPLIGLYSQWPWQWTLEGHLTAETAHGHLETLKYRYEPTPIAQLRSFRLLVDVRCEVTVAAYLLLCLLWALAVWGAVGGAITRIACVELAAEEQLSWGRVLAHVRAKWASYVAGPLLPLVGILITTIPLAIVGLLMLADWGVAVVGVIWPLLLIGGLVMTILALGLAAGWPLMWATVSTEGTDSFDALSRSYAYVFQRPLKYLLYVVFAVLLGLLGLLVVLVFAEAVIYLTAWSTSWGAGGARTSDLLFADRDKMDGALGFGASAIRWWGHGVWLLAQAFLFSYFWTSACAIYLLMRRDVDATEMDEVHLDEQDEQYHLPRLDADEAGVPGVPDSPGESVADSEPEKPAGTDPPAEEATSSG